MNQRIFLSLSLALAACGGPVGPRTFEVDLVGCDEPCRVTPGSTVRMLPVADRVTASFTPLRGQGVSEERPVPVERPSATVLSGADAVELRGLEVVAKKPGTAVIEVSGEVGGHRTTSQEVVRVEAVAAVRTTVQASHALLIAGVPYFVVVEAQDASGQALPAPASALPPGLPGLGADGSGDVVLAPGDRIRGVTPADLELDFEAVVPDALHLTPMGDGLVRADLSWEGRPVSLPHEVQLTVRTPQICSLSPAAGGTEDEETRRVDPDRFFLRGREGVSEGRCVLAFALTPGEDPMRLDAEVDVGSL